MLKLPKSKYILTNLYILLSSSFGFAILLVGAVESSLFNKDFFLHIGGVILSAYFVILNIVKLFGNTSIKHTELSNGIFLWLQFFQVLIFGVGFKFVLGTQFLLILNYQDGVWSFEIFENLWKYEFAIVIGGELSRFIAALNIIPLFFYWLNFLTKNE